MLVVNETKGFTISSDAQMRDTAEGRRKGLMGSERMDVILAVAWESRLMSMIHMFGMGYPIDVIWVNGKMEAVDVRLQVPRSKLLSPSTWFSMPKKGAKYVVEIGKGDIRDTACGDKLSFR